MKKEGKKKLCYYLMCVLLAIGFLSYVIQAENPPTPPPRIMFSTMGGDVLFGHKTHFSEDGFGIECTDCHHSWEQEEGTMPKSCSECHPKEGEEEIKRADALHQQCKGCHEEGGSGPVECKECHIFF